MRKRWMTATAAALLAAGMICGCSNPQKAGVKALEEGNYEEAETQFTELTEESGKDGAEGYRGLGMVYYETEEYQKALEAFETSTDRRWNISVRDWHWRTVHPRMNSLRKS